MPRPRLGCLALTLTVIAFLALVAVLTPVAEAEPAVAQAAAEAGRDLRSLGQQPRNRRRSGVPARHGQPRPGVRVVVGRAPPPVAGPCRRVPFGHQQPVDGVDPAVRLQPARQQPAKVLRVGVPEREQVRTGVRGDRGLG